MEQLEYAKHLVTNNLNVIPIKPDGSKKPSIDWKLYQSTKTNPAALEQWFDPDAPNDIGIVCGKISNNLTVIDFDEKNGHSFDEWKTAIPEALLNRLMCVQTPSGGYHIYFHCSRSFHCKKLAKSVTGLTLIETRGDGGYVLGPTATDGKYKIISSVELPPMIEDHEANMLIIRATLLNKYDYEAHEPTETPNNGDHSEAVAKSVVPVKERISQASTHLARCPATEQGRNADGYCFAIAVELVWGYLLPVDDAIELLYFWGQGGKDQYGHPYPWTFTECKHKINSAIKSSYKNKAGDKLDFEKQLLEMLYASREHTTSSV